MKTTFLLLVAFSTSVITQMANFNTSAIKQFAAEFYQITAAESDGKNFISSPLSAYIALGMLSYATLGKSQEQILSALHLPNDEINNARSFWNLKNKLKQSRGAELHLAKMLYIDSGISMVDRYQRILNSFFDAEYQSVNFNRPHDVANEINNRSDQLTNHLIKHVVTSDDILGALMIMISALYFKGSWKESFWPDVTQSDKFHVNDHLIVNVTMMFINTNLNVRTHDDLDAQSFELKYGDSEADEFSMFIIRPNNIDGLDEIEKNLHKLDLSNNAGVQEKNVALILPKFSIKSDLDLVPILQKMGVKDIFDGRKSKFTLINKIDSLKIEKFSQNAILNVDEYGSEAAAVTVVGAAFYSLDDPEMITIDRPFLYAIVMRDTGLPIFYGRLVNPTIQQNMTTIGRGRGWGKLPQDNSSRRPGVQHRIIDERGKDEWVERVNQLDINDDTVTKSPNSPIANLISDVTTKVCEEDSKHLDNLCKEALEDREFSVKLIMAFTHPTNKKSCLLSALQPYYDARDDLIKQNPMQFLNLVFILGEIYHRIIVGGIPVIAVEKPLIICLKTLLEMADEDEIELAVTQVAINGRTLHSRSVEGLSELFIYARQVLATRNLSKRSRGMLLLMLDLYNQKFLPLSGELQKFYAEQLGQETLLAMQRSSKGLLIVTDLQTSAPKPVETTNSPGILMQVQPKMEKNPKNYHSSQQNSGGRPMNSIPRAIRGSGATETNREGKKYSAKKDKNSPSDAQWSKWNDTGSKNWGHDDRFSKDY